MKQQREVIALVGILIICIAGIGSVYLIHTESPTPAPEIVVQGGHVLTQTADQTVIRAMALSMQVKLSSDAAGFLNNHDVQITNIDTERVSFSSDVPYSIVHSNVSSNMLRLETQMTNASITMETSDTPPLNFFVLGDSQGYQGSIEEIIATANMARPNMLFHCGDITPFGQEKQYQRFDDTAVNLSVPLFLTAGNHDIKLNGGQRYQSRYGPSTYSFDFGGAHFIIFNSSAGDVSETTLQWLENDLSTAMAQHKFVFTHIPPFDPRPEGNHTLLNTTTAMRLMDIFESESVDVVFAGHIHMFNVSNRNNVTYVITGGAGATLYEAAEKGGIHHYVNVTVSDSQIEIEPILLGEPSFARDQVVVRGKDEDITLTIEDLMQLPAIEGFSSFQNQLGNWQGQGNYVGVKISDLLSLVGGMTPENTVRVIANDGYQQEFCYGNVYPNESWYQLQGDMILAYSYNGTTVPDWSIGLRLVMLPEDCQYSIEDCLQTSAPGTGCNIYLSAGARWIRYTQIIEVIP